MQQAIRQAFSGKGARFGAAWVLLLVILAVFSPFLVKNRETVQL